jgi:hypothetical protein
MTTQSPKITHIVSNVTNVIACLLAPKEGWYQNSNGIPGFPAATFPSSMASSLLSVRVVPGSESEWLLGAEERFETITWLRRDACDCGHANINSVRPHMGRIKAKYDCKYLSIRVSQID